MSAPRILVVEDDADQRLALSIRLKAEKFAVSFAGDGATAISAVQRERPDLIVLDLGLPGGDGFTVMNRLRAIPRLASIPVIVITARDPQQTRDQSRDLGAAAYFQKPVDNAEFLEAIRVALGDSS